MKTKVKILGLIAVLLLVTASLIAPSLTVQAADTDFSNGITVDSTGDGADANIGDNICDDGSGSCTLRAAIEEANAVVGTQTIRFNITGTADFSNDGADGYTIAPGIDLPALTDSVVIDGYTQPGAQANTAVAPNPLNGTLLIELDGSGVLSSFGGLSIEAADITIRGLVINNWISEGILVNGNNAVIHGNYIGTDPEGTTAQPNVNSGITGWGGTGNDVLLGGADPAARNIISGNGTTPQGSGIGLGPNHNNWQIKGNYIGLAADGVTAIPNAQPGGSGSPSIDFVSGTIVGGLEEGAINVISGNLGHGIAPFDAPNTTIQGNYIGTDYTGTVPIGNSFSGIAMNFSENSIIDSNIIAHNDNTGIFLADDTSVTVSNNQIISNGNGGIGLSATSGVDIFDNVINDNTPDGIYVNDSESVLIQGNSINNSTSSGVGIDSSSEITIGGTASGEGNDVTDSGNSGIYVFDSSSEVSAFGNTIEGNAARGIYAENSSNITIGGTASGEGNDVVANGTLGVDIDGATGLAIHGNLVESNTQGGIGITGTDESVATNNTVVNNGRNGVSITDSNFVSLDSNNSGGNAEHGISLSNSDDAIITGGSNSSNAQSGISVGDSVNTSISDVETADNQENGIVTNSGVTAIYDSQITGNGENGISFNAGANDGIAQGNTITGNAQSSANSAGIIVSANSAQIGGPLASNRNVISGNRGQANVLVVGFGVPVSGNVVQGNYIGTANDGTIDNTMIQNAGITMVGLVSDTLLGGTQPGTGNIISDNDGAGITVARLQVPTVFDFVPTNNAIVGNSVVENDQGTSAGLGIDLVSVNGATGDIDSSGVTPNDTDDIDVGANNLMNFPVINSASQNLLELSANIDLDAADSPTDQYRVEFFANDTADPTNYGEGQTFLGAAVVAPGDGQDITVTMPSGTNLTGKVLSATTTAIDGTTTSGFGSTSEFSLVSNVDIIALPQESTSIVGVLANTGLSVIAGIIAGGLLIVAARVTSKTGNNHNY